MCASSAAGGTPQKHARGPARQRTGEVSSAPERQGARLRGSVLIVVFDVDTKGLYRGAVASLQEELSSEGGEAVSLEVELLTLQRPGPSGP